MLTNIVLPSASINEMLQNIFKTLDMWGNSGAKIFGLICLVVGMYALGQALLDLRKHQPSGLHWLVAVLGLIIGGYFLGGLKAFENIATDQGQQSVNNALKGKG